MADIKKTTYYRYQGEEDRVLDCIKEYLEEQGSTLFSSVIVTTDEDNKKCVKISYSDGSYVNFTYRNLDDPFQFGYGFTAKLYNKTAKYITTTDHGGASVYGYPIANTNWDNDDFWYGNVNGNLFIASCANTGTKTSSNDIWSLSFIIFRTDKSIIAQSYTGSAPTYTGGENGSLAVLSPFDGNDVYIIESKGSGTDYPWLKEYTNYNTQAKYYKTVPVQLSLDEESYLVIGNVAIKE